MMFDVDGVLSHAGGLNFGVDMCNLPIIASVWLFVFFLKIFLFFCTTQLEASTPAADLIVRDCSQCLHTHVPLCPRGGRDHC